MGLSVIEVPLTRGLSALIDESDALLIDGASWCAAERQGTYYAQARIGGRLWYMHRFILGLPERRPLVDHRDGDGLNNQRSNLRIATNGQNGANRSAYGSTSRFKGVRQRASGRWGAQITKDRQPVPLGTFDTEEEAAMAYNAAAIELHGDFAFLNGVR